MALSQSDRITFSLSIVNAATQIAGILNAKAQLQAQLVQAQNLDTANANLFSPVNVLVNGYQTELNNIDGKVRTPIVDQDIIDSANRILDNHFFPNDTTVTVPSLVPYKNIWAKLKPFALTYAIGKNYTEGYGTTNSETTLTSQILAYIASASANQDIENTTGQHCISGSCSLPQFTTESTCTTGGGTWDPSSSSIVTFDDVQTLKTNIVAAVQSLLVSLQAEAAAVVQTDPTNSTINNAALANLNTNIIPAIQTWLGYSDFNQAPAGVTTCSAFYALDPSTLAPTKLYSVTLNTLKAALMSRQTFVTTRTTQLNTILGTLTQDLDSGELTSSTGLYGKRYGFLGLRLNVLGGSLIQVVGLQQSISAQDGIVANIKSTTGVYQGIVPTSILQANGNGTAVVSVADVSSFAVGDTVYVTSVGQDELQRAVKSIDGNSVTLNDAIPSKYRVSDKARIYKDIS